MEFMKLAIGDEDYFGIRSFSIRTGACPNMHWESASENSDMIATEGHEIVFYKNGKHLVCELRKQLPPRSV